MSKETYRDRYRARNSEIENEQSSKGSTTMYPSQVFHESDRPRTKMRKRRISPLVGMLALSGAFLLGNLTGGFTYYLYIRHRLIEEWASINQSLDKIHAMNEDTTRLNERAMEDVRAARKLRGVGE